MKEEVILKLKTIIKSSKSIVFFGGAGVSVPSGIPDFRSADGIYIKARNAKYSAEQIVSHSFFYTYPDVFYDFYISKMVNLKAKPNVVHHYLANLEAKGLLKAVITQNIEVFTKWPAVKMYLNCMAQFIVITARSVLRLLMLMY